MQENVQTKKKVRTALLLNINVNLKQHVKIKKKTNKLQFLEHSAQQYINVQHLKQLSAILIQMKGR